MLAMQIWALIVDSFREAIERKLFWIFAGLTLFVAVLMACIGISDEGVSIFFGKWFFETDLFAPSTMDGRARIGAILTKYIGDFYIGFIGIVIALIATCGAFPSLMERGAIDVALSKPISRRALFLGKYLGSMVFVLMQSTLFVVLTLLVAGLRWNYWSLAYLGCIPLFVILYSYIYAFTALFGVMTRNAMAAMLLSMLAWVFMFLPQLVYETLDSADSVGFNVDRKWVDVAKTAKLIVPNTTDITYIAGNMIGASVATELSSQPTTQSVDAGVLKVDLAKASESERRVSKVNPFTSIGSSLLFEAVIVWIALRLFSRREF